MKSIADGFCSEGPGKEVLCRFFVLFPIIYPDLFQILEHENIRSKNDENLKFVKN